MDLEDLKVKLRYEDFKLLILISLLKINDSTNASGNSRNYSLRLNESLISLFNCFSRLSETLIEDDKKFIEQCKLEAKQVYNTLI